MCSNRIYEIIFNLSDTHFSHLYILSQEWHFVLIPYYYYHNSQQIKLKYSLFIDFISSLNYRDRETSASLVGNAN